MSQIIFIQLKINCSQLKAIFLKINILKKQVLNIIKQLFLNDTISKDQISRD